MFSFLEKKGILYLEMNTLKTTEDVGAPSVITIAWFPSRGLAADRNNPPEPRTQGWIIFFD